ncbi:ras-related protein Rab-10-like [Limulus polyphemus]|uniref:Ras-related protein Rab-10-like n=1 Tax=Limulus polyphemus TaxID=6850 RepID=A0ABM1C3Q5_LIMPO|nr:ras-related protein Rab-10-like [Limulus polyphemus]XP_013793621.1 ras-related protein Rab-10-like [Limulus polyphemus]
MGIMLVYDITNPKSFDNIAKWLRNIDEHANEDVEKMILGNKCDVSDKRMISKERGDAIAREHGIRFLETSAKANVNIERAFLELTDAILSKQLAGKDQTEVLDKVRIASSDNKSGGKCC